MIGLKSFGLKGYPMCDVLIIEDDPYFIELYQRSLRDLEVEFAGTLEVARQKYKANPNVSVIAIDGGLGSTKLNTLGLIREIKSSFPRHLIAISGSEIRRKLQMDVGCNEQCKKEDLPDKIRLLLAEARTKKS